MYPEAQTFWIEPTGSVAVGLRRYVYSSDAHCSGPGGYHNALVYTGIEDAIWQDGPGRGKTLDSRPMPDHDDENWPVKCAHCDYVFTDADQWQAWQELIYRAPSTGQEYVLHSRHPDSIPTAPPGACWDAWWLPDYYRGSDGIALQVRLPNGRDWQVDTEASNCTRKGEPHQCWVRHGDPHEEHLTVDKDGDTCTAGAGSISSGDYHGFLIKGVLTAG